jgi:hypothetical protein
MSRSDQWFTTFRSTLKDLVDNHGSMLNKIETHKSPSERYQINVYYWEIHDVVVPGSKTNIILTVDVVDRRFPKKAIETFICLNDPILFQWVEGHSSGADYLLLSEHPSHIAVLRLLPKPKSIKHDLYNYVSTGIESGEGLVIADLEVNPGGTLISVFTHGVYDCPCVRVLEFADPRLCFQSLEDKPLFAYEERIDEFVGWEDDETILIGVENDCRAGDLKPFDEMTAKEKDLSVRVGSWKKSLTIYKVDIVGNKSYVDTIVE